jgi:cytochrome c oxidase subunit II
MNGAFLLPEGSTSAPEVDALLGVLLATSIAVLVLVFGLMLLYVVRYRAGNGLDRGAVAKKTWRIEIGWTAVTLAIFFGLFIWGADLYLRVSLPPPDALKISVIGKQWMWKVEHPAGQHEINALHVPVNRAVELLMTSEDVIHDFDIPAFRIKHDVLPGRYETLWFTADKVGTYRLYCSQFCGTDHSGMGGQIIVMSASDFQNWLATAGTGETLAAAGRTLFVRYGCSGCHEAEGRGGNGTVRAPSLNGLYGSPVPLSDGSVIVADDRYIHDSIVTPKTQVVASYAPLMPSFAGVVGEEDLVKLIAYIESLAAIGETK